MPTKVLEIDLIRSLPPVVDLTGYDRLLVLVRLNGTPLGQMDLGNLSISVTAKQLNVEISHLFIWQISQHILRSQFIPDHPSLFLPADWTIVVCTLNRADQLKNCLDSLLPFQTAGATVLIVDNAPSDSSTAT